jgi:hypothetical protein
MIRRTAVKKRRTGKPRRGPLRCKDYRKWVVYFCCVVCGGWPTEAAHTQNNGMGSKGPDSSCAPLCSKHHREYDAGRKAFEEKYNIDVKRHAADFWARYQKEQTPCLAG